ncbi:MAG: type II secretion system F family protein [Candidatus Saccharibacteria bacterium]|nr:type II secretion system F family protein [Candidatus Saccharibacteria bacterium]
MSVTLSGKDKLEILGNITTMLHAGISLSEAVDSLLEDNKGASRNALNMFRDELHEGRSLSVAMKKMPKSFDAVTINLIAAGEESGTLVETLEDVTKNIRKELAFNDKIKASLMYPAFVMGILAAVMILILTFVIPRISEVFLGLNVELPLATRVLIQMSAFFTNNLIFVGLGTVLIVTLLILLIKTKKHAMANMLLSLPGFKKLGREIDLARFTRSMGLLLSSGITASEGLALAKASVLKKDISRAVDHMAKNVEAGKPMSTDLRTLDKDVIPPVMIRLMQTAEQSGTLETTFRELSTYFSNQVSRTLKTFIALLEPILLVVVGLLVGGIMLAIIAPIYGLISQINT